jgi:GNAT superfamily N-acetyltransferase
MHDVVGIFVEIADPESFNELETLLIAFKTDDAKQRTPLELSASRRLLADPTSGRVYRIDIADELAGYAILCWGYSVEYGGRDAFLDEFYIVPKWRGQGFGAQVLMILEQKLREIGIQAMHLEVLSAEARNASLYGRAGFTDRGSRLMTKRLVDA